jgi:hypothetical protein
MTFYIGSSKDGSDMHEHLGVYINPNNPDEWSNMPYNSEQRMHDRIQHYMDKTGKSLHEIKLDIDNKVSDLPATLRNEVLAIIATGEYEDMTDFKSELQRIDKLPC